jgi:hypothetical protein
LPLSHGITVGNTAMVKRRGMKVIDATADRSKCRGISSTQLRHRCSANRPIGNSFDTVATVLTKRKQPNLMKMPASSRVIWLP